jgi:Domain of unknown function (DUF4129)
MDYILSLSFAVAVVGVAISIWALVTSRGEMDLDAKRKQGRLLTAMFIIALIVGMALGRHFVNIPALSGQDGGAAGGRPRTATTTTGTHAERPYEPDFQWIPVVVLLGAGVATWIGFRESARRRKRRLAGKTDEELAGELAQLLDDTLDDLRAEPDPRRAVIAAYARTERALGGYGFPRRPFEAPLEYLDRIAGPLHERHPSARRLVFELTHLFERAKFSSHVVDAEMKDDAIRTLAALRDDLRGSEEAA